MRTPRLALAMLLLTSCLGTVSAATPIAALADCSSGLAYPSVDEVKGDTFVGAFEGLTRGTDRDVLHWTVERVYAGDLRPGRLDDWGYGRPSCHPTHYTVGQRYLVGAAVGGGDAFATIAYRMLGGGRVRLVSFQGPVAGYPQPYQVTRFATALAVLAPSLPASDTSPSASPTAAPSLPVPSTPSPDVRWSLVDGVLGNAIPGLWVDTDPPVAALGRFWTLETEAVASPDQNQSGDAVVWQEPAIWGSTDGRTWDRHRVPRGMTGRLTLMPWRDGLLIADRRDDPHDPAGIRFVVWTSPDGRRWSRLGALTARPAPGRDCWLGGEGMGTAGNGLVIWATCQVLTGTGGDIGPGYATTALAARIAGAREPATTYTWTSPDGHHWTRHAVHVAAGIDDRTRLRTVGAGVAMLVRGRTSRLTWSADGAIFPQVADLPDDLDLPYDIEATVDVAGRPRTWLLLIDDTGGPRASGGGGAVIRLVRDGAWQRVVAVGPPEQGDITVDGDRVLVVTTRPGPDTGEQVRVSSSLSDDAGATWASSVDPDLIEDCVPSVAMLSGFAVLGCPSNGWSGMRHATLR